MQRRVEFIGYCTGYHHEGSRNESHCSVNFSIEHLSDDFGSVVLTGVDINPKQLLLWGIIAGAVGPSAGTTKNMSMAQRETRNWNLPLSASRFDHCFASFRLQDSLLSYR